MSATLQLSRPLRTADAAWPYQIVLDGQAAGKFTNGNSTSLQIAAGTHTLQVRSLHIVLRHLRFASPTVTFDLDDDQTAEFECHARPLVQIPYWLIASLAGPRSRWIVLERAHPQRRADAN